MTETPAPASEPDETTAAAPSTQVTDDATDAAASAAVNDAPSDDVSVDGAAQTEGVVPVDVAGSADDDAAPVAASAQDDAAEDAPAAAAPEAEEPAAEAVEAPAADSDASTTDEPDAPAAPTPPTPASVRPTPRPHPGPRPVPHPPAHPVAPAAGAPAAAAPTAPPLDAAEAAHAATFGRVDDEGTVFVRESAGERVVGQFPGATSDEALALYVRRFLDLQAKVALFEARLTATDLSVKEIDQTLARLTDEVAEPAAVGDLDGLRTRLDALRTTAAERRAVAEAERAAAREAAVAARTEIVEQAERVASTDPSRIQWRPAGEQLRGLLDQWKEAQRTGPRLDRPTEEALWKRFSHARTTFDRERRHFFAELETRNASAKAAKEALVVEAEKLQSSTDWGATAGAFRDLMTQWKAAGRASRADDDALWARFRAAQDAFFAARDAQAAATDTEFRANLEVKEALLVEAEALVPVTDLAAAKQALRSIQDRWESAGKVPRADIQRIEGRLRAVETAVRDADQSQWRRTNPETRARAEGAAAQLEQAIAGLEADLAKAEAAGDARRIAEARAALDARRSWLEQVQRAAEEARG
ncbi:DUF349 domain-containing protein [Cellulomonas sp.]|uniref:DUF349 domain-containing protein n=1 Tax=Cellulomonas sp. TaxID=40001 RepID=UPI001B2276CA|nr:DUF349 domain-containing protein [Cellulomonas sp.]MBO9555714.1 DUF349 domain-containing protein [Cellulomonas sp.]